MKETEFTESSKSDGRVTAGIRREWSAPRQKHNSEFDELVRELVEALEELIYWTDLDYEVNHGRKDMPR